MNEFSFKCPNCDVVITADESELGVQAACPECETKLTLPSFPGGQAQLIQEMGEKKSRKAKPDLLPITSGDMGGVYEAVGMVCFTTGTAGPMADDFQRRKLELMLKSDDVETAFLVIVSELQSRAHTLNANAIVGFRYDIHFDSLAGALSFIATGYGTAVRVKQKQY